jgi:hypothetical protein
MRRSHLHCSVVAGADVITGTVDDDESLSAQHVEALFKGMDVRIDSAVRRELVDAQSGENRALGAMDERLVSVALAVPLEYQVVPKSGRVEAREEMHLNG